MSPTESADAMQRMIDTPTLLLDEPRMRANIARMRERMATLGVALRPHVKTAKSIEVASVMFDEAPAPITVSTLLEAEVFADHGYDDITYAVGIAPNKFRRIAALLARGVKLQLTLDSLEAARLVADASKGWPSGARILIEIDTDGHRAGVRPDDVKLLEIAAILAGGGAPVGGVLTHAGGSYDCRSADSIREVAEQERAGAVGAADRLRRQGHDASVVSVGSTPTALFAKALPGVTEVRAGVYVFFDLVMAGLGVCSVDDIAISVLTSVIGHQRERGWTIVDAGWMAMSRDRGTADQRLDQGYGLVCSADGAVLPDYLMVSANQEHGIIAHRSGDPARILDLPIGTMLRVLPNHACATGAQFDGYRVLGAAGAADRYWQRFHGW